MQHLANTIRLARLPVLLSLAVFALILVACQANRTASDSPEAEGGLVAQPTEVDLGNVPFDQQADARFVLVNRGSSEVHLDSNVEVQKLEGC